MPRTFVLSTRAPRDGNSLSLLAGLAPQELCRDRIATAAAVVSISPNVIRSPAA